jgi:hypothetical protein
LRKGLTGNVKHSNGMKWSQQRLNEYKMLKRRKVLPGFPVDKVFQTKEEIDEYLSGDRIVCLLCGKSYKSLCSHIGVHGFNVDGYREKYGLPFRSGLCGENTSELISKHFKKLVKDGIIGKPTEENIKKMQSAVHNQRFQPFRKQVAIDNINKTKLINKKNLKRCRERKTFVYWEDTDYDKILSLALENELHPHDVIKKFKDLVPSKSQFNDRKKFNSEYKEKYYSCVDKLPFTVQAAHDMLGNRFLNQLKILKQENKTNFEIACLLNVHEITVEKYCHKNNISRPIKNACKYGHPYSIDGKRHCKICNTNNKRKSRGYLPREIAKKTIVTRNCTHCGIEIKTNRLAMSRPVVYCDICKRNFYLASQKKYAEANRVKRIEMARIAREKYKQKNKDK